MLVLTRKIDESIIVGKDVEIKVLEIKGDQVKIGVAAPRDIAVHRKEVYESIVAANKSAVVSSLDLIGLASIVKQNDSKVKHIEK